MRDLWQAEDLSLLGRYIAGRATSAQSKLLRRLRCSDASCGGAQDDVGEKGSAAFLSRDCGQDGALH